MRNSSSKGSYFQWSGSILSSQFSPLLLLWYTYHIYYMMYYIIPLVTSISHPCSFHYMETLMMVSIATKAIIGRLPHLAHDVCALCACMMCPPDVCAWCARMICANDVHAWSACMMCVHDMCAWCACIMYVLSVCAWWVQMMCAHDVRAWCVRTLCGHDVCTHGAMTSCDRSLRTPNIHAFLWLPLWPGDITRVAPVSPGALKCGKVTGWFSFFSIWFFNMVFYYFYWA